MYKYKKPLPVSKVQDSGDCGSCFPLGWGGVGTREVRYASVAREKGLSIGGLCVLFIREVRPGSIGDLDVGKKARVHVRFGGVNRVLVRWEYFWFPALFFLFSSVRGLQLRIAKMFWGGGMQDTRSTPHRIAMHIPPLRAGCAAQRQGKAHVQHQSQPQIFSKKNCQKKNHHLLRR